LGTARASGYRRAIDTAAKVDGTTRLMPAESHAAPVAEADPPPFLATLAARAQIVGLGLMLPGLGYAYTKNWTKLAINFILLEGLFLLGLLYFDAPVYMPVMQTNSEEFSPINVLIFLGQMTNGLTALIALVGFRGSPEFLGAQAHQWYADLGAFCLLAAGGMNYFAIIGALDAKFPPPEPPATERAKS